MLQIIFSVYLLVLIASGSALPEVCQSGAIFDMNTLKGVHLTSYCILESVMEDVNSVSENYGSDFDCNPKSLYDMGDQQEQSSLFLTTCLLATSRRPGDNLPLSKETVRQRIASAADSFLDAMKDDHNCPAKKLEQVKYTEALDKMDEYGQCMLHQMLKDLTHPDDLYNMDF